MWQKTLLNKALTEVLTEMPAKKQTIEKQLAGRRKHAEMWAEEIR